jgi:hypothetical protein
MGQRDLEFVFAHYYALTHEKELEDGQNYKR